MFAQARAFTRAAMPTATPLDRRGASVKTSASARPNWFPGSDVPAYLDGSLPWCVFYGSRRMGKQCVSGRISRYASRRDSDRFVVMIADGAGNGWRGDDDETDARASVSSCVRHARRDSRDSRDATGVMDRASFHSVPGWIDMISRASGTKERLTL